MAMNERVLYCFLDEGGNFDFSDKGSRYFTYTCLTTKRPFFADAGLDAYKYDLIEYGLAHHYFHACEDNKHDKGKVFGALSNHLNSFKLDSVIIDRTQVTKEKRNQHYVYTRVFAHLLAKVIKEEFSNQSNIPTKLIVITDTIPINTKRKVVEGNIKQTLQALIPKGVKYHLLHHPSSSHYGLQIADYCNWAILRRWERGEDLYYTKIQEALRSEYSQFNYGS